MIHQGAERSFGPIIIDYDQVQSKVGGKYDLWQREILNRFGSLLGNNIQNLYQKTNKARLQLEKQINIDAQSTEETVQLIIIVQDFGREQPEWTYMVNLSQSGHRLLETQRFVFPSRLDLF